MIPILFSQSASGVFVMHKHAGGFGAEQLSAAVYRIGAFYVYSSLPFWIGHLQTIQKSISNAGGASVDILAVEPLGTGNEFMLILWIGEIPTGQKIIVSAGTARDQLILSGMGAMVNLLLHAGFPVSVIQLIVSGLGTETADKILAGLGISIDAALDAGMGVFRSDAVFFQLGVYATACQAIQNVLSRGDHADVGQAAINTMPYGVIVDQTIDYEFSPAFYVNQDILSLISGDPARVAHAIQNTLMTDNEIQRLQKLLLMAAERSAGFYSVSAEIYLDGRPLSGRITGASITFDETAVHNEITITSADPDLFRLADPDMLRGDARIEAQIGGRMIQFLLDTRSGEMTNFTLSGLSVSAKEDSPYAADMDFTLSAPALASEIAAGLTTYCPVDWDVVDWMVPSDFEFSGPPLDGVQALADAVGAVVRCQDDGSLLVRYPRPVRPVNMPTASADVDYSRSTLVSLSHSEEPASGYNAVVVTGRASDTFVPKLRLEEIFEGNTTRRPYQAETCFVRVYWAGHDADVSEAYTTDGSIEIIAGGALYTENVTETVEFTAGSASVSLPVHGIESLTWIGDDGGDVSYDVYSKDLTISDSRFRIAEITYQTRYQRYRLTGHNVERLMAVLFLSFVPDVYVSVRTADAARYAEPIDAPLLTTDNAASIRGRVWIDANKYRRSQVQIEAPYNDNAIDGNLAYIDDAQIGHPGNYHIKSSRIIIDGPKITNVMEVEQCLI